MHMEQRSNSAGSAQLDRALDILEFLTQAGSPRTLAEVIDAVDAPKATVHRLLATLRERGYVTRDPLTSRYSAGVRCFELGSMWAQSLDLRAVAAPHLSALTEATGETVHLAVYDHTAGVYVDKLESRQPVVAKSSVGRRCPATCVATGRALKGAGRVNRILLQTVGSTGDVYAGYPYLSAYGGGIFAKTPGGGYSPDRLIVDDDASVRGADQLAQLSRQGVISKDVDNTNAVPLFGDGRAPYLITGAWSMPVIRDSGVPYAISPVPELSGGGRPRPLLDVDLFYVSAHADRPAIAQEFVRDCATRRDVQVRLARATGLPPALTSAYHQVAAKDPDYAGWFTAGESGDPVPALPQMRAVWGPLAQAFADIVAGDDPATRLRAASHEITSDL